MASITSHPGTKNIKNLALCNPQDLMLDGTFLKHTETDENYSLFYTTGVMSQSILYDDEAQNRQVNFLPFACIWYRLVAVLGQIFNSKKLFFSTFKGVSASTKSVGTGGGSKRDYYVH